MSGNQIIKILIVQINVQYKIEILVIGNYSVLIINWNSKDNSLETKFAGAAVDGRRMSNK